MMNSQNDELIHVGNVRMMNSQNDELIHVGMLE